MNNTIEKEKTAAITSYILGIGVFIMSMNSEDKNTFASFHIRQGWELHLLSFHSLIISNFDSLLISSMWVFVSVLWSYGIFSAIKGETKPMPILGDLFKMVFKYLLNINSTIST
jgi:uncharacterized membrane protein